MLPYPTPVNAQELRLAADIVSLITAAVLTQRIADAKPLLCRRSVCPCARQRVGDCPHGFGAEDSTGEP